MEYYLIKLDHSKLNSMTSDFMRWLLAELDKAGDRGVLLYCEDSLFCAGADLNEVANASADEVLAYVKLMEQVLERLIKHPAPTVASVSGHAMGGGFLLFMCCDFAFALDDERVKIGLPEVAAGVLVSPWLINLFKRLLPFPLLRKLLLSTTPISPQEALDHQLFEAISQDPLALAKEKIKQLCRLPRPAYYLTRQDLFNDKPSQAFFEKNVKALVESGDLKRN